MTSPSVFNVYGHGEVPGKYRNVIPNFFYWAMKNLFLERKALPKETKAKALPITGDGTETRDWTYVDDIIDGLLAMGIKEEAVGEAINLGSGKEHRVIDLAKMVNKEISIIIPTKNNGDILEKYIWLSLNPKTMCP